MEFENILIFIIIIFLTKRISFIYLLNKKINKSWRYYMYYFSYTYIYIYSKKIIIQLSLIYIQQNIKK